MVRWWDDTLLFYTHKEISHKTKTKNIWGRTVLLLFMDTMRIYGNKVTTEYLKNLATIEENLGTWLAAYSK